MGDRTRSHPPAGDPTHKEAERGKNQTVRMTQRWFFSPPGTGHLTGERKLRESPPSSAVLQAAAQWQRAAAQRVGVPEKTSRLPGRSKSALHLPPEGEPHPCRHSRSSWAEDEDLGEDTGRPTRGAGHWERPTETGKNPPISFLKDTLYL